MKHLSAKSVTINPLKMSQPLGAALAYMGIDKSMPLFHGAQGCTAFGMVLLVRHFREPIPLQTTAINELTAIMGGSDSIDQAILNIHKRTSPEFIGIATTGLTETRGEDIIGDLLLFRKKHPELDNVMIIQTATPDYTGSFSTGWSKAVESIIDQAGFICGETVKTCVNLLPGSHLSPGDVSEIKEILDAFGLESIVLPDISASMYGNQYDDFIPTTSGGTSVKKISEMGNSGITIAIGSQMEEAAKVLKEKTGVPFVLFERLMGLEPVDEFINFLAQYTGKPVPEKFNVWRQRLIDSMLDGHFYFGGKQISIAGEPDLVYEYASWFRDMGAVIHCAATTFINSVLRKMDFVKANVADLEDLERESTGVDLLVTHSHGRQASERTGIPLYRAGFPVFDRVGAAHMIHVGYRGTMEAVIDVANIFIDNEKHGEKE